MYLISTGKSTILTEFADLDTKSIYRHVNSESTDFQFCAQQRIFVEVNKKSGLEILRIKEKVNQKLEIQRVRKLTIKNVYCVACAKQAPEEMALGLSNGTVKIYNYKNAEIVKRFNAENIRNSVLYIDYNASDEYICSVCENGQINIYGTKTSAKLDTVNIDGNSTLARFHPTKRFHMAIASYKGTVSIYDVQTKRKLFHSVDSHTAPCRDLCMSPSSPDTLVSVGFDCLVNIFDTRRKTQPLQLRHNHPLSTVALSECGNFCCVGNLKGELIAYDMRKLKYSLGTKKIHDCAVTRIAFVPHGADAAVSFSSTGNLTNASVAAIDCTNAERQLGGGDLRKSLVAKLGSDKTARGQRDSFCDFLDFQSNKGLEKISSRFVTHRDSNDFWDALHRKPSSDEQRASLCTLNSANNSAVTAACDSFDNKPDISKKSTETLMVPSIQAPAPASLPLRDHSNNMALTPGSKLVQIIEEQPQQNISSGSDKENPVLDLELLSRLQKLPADRNSTPNRSLRRSEGANNAAIASSKPVAPAESIAELRAEMNSRFQQLESEMKFQLETNKWQIFTQNFNLWSKHNQNNEVISDALGILLQTDPFVNEFLRLKQENEDLKLQLLSMAKK